jgi:outer membrane protein TolC
MRNSKHFHDDGDRLFNEDPDWVKTLERDKDGNVVLTPDKSVLLGVQNSTSYRDQIDTLYFAALALSFVRFNFAAHWYGTNNTIFDHFGSSDTEVNTLTTTTDFGFTRNLAAGGQFIFDIANSFVFTFSGVNQYVSPTTITLTFMQPLLRGFGRRVTLEPLTESERNVLYAVRTFARFRKTFYVNLTTANNGGYLSLLLQLQNTRDLEANVKSNESNFRLNEALLASGSVSTVQVDQAFTSYQQAKLGLLLAESGLQSSLDQYKLNLGLPPTLPVRVDDSALKPFQLSDPRLEQLQQELDVFFADYREMAAAPPVSKMQDGYGRLLEYHARLMKLLAGVEAELQRWRPNVGKTTEDEGHAQRERATYENLARQLPELRDELTRLATTFKKAAGDLSEKTRKLDWERLQLHIRQEISSASELFVVQNQIRVYLIELKPIPAKLDDAIAYARANRLDLMNERATVVDTWRQVYVTADALRAGLLLTTKAAIATPPTTKNPVDFRASASDYSIGAQFDSPLNRLAARNAYRTAQINYEKERRNFIALDDQITASIRQDLRQLETERASFAIGRQNLISAARQVEAARDNLLLADKGAGTTLSQDVLTALNSLLQAKSTLISSWINYETTRVQLLLDMEALQVDDRGIAIDEHDHQSDQRPDEPLPSSRRLPGAAAGGAEAQSVP